MNVEEVAEELYGLKPSEFVAARDAYAAQARKTKDTAAAKAIAALRRPVLAAWAANLLAHERRQEAAQFLTLGETLREAHRTLDADQLRAASRQQQQLITALARTAAALASEAGQSVSDTVLYEIEQTLHGVLADPDVAEQWSKGRLVKVPEAAVDFAAVTPETVPARPAPVEQPGPKKKPGREAARLRDLERARTTAEEADAEVGRRERELAKARDAQESADGKREEAAERVRRMEHELQGARQAKAEAKAAEAEAGTAVKAAERALREARRSAEQAAHAVQRLEQPTES
ncbi:hypothetical protein OG361_04090 [Streptomyces sp. NBC_00090]|uniref:hypothetical protein n=1 Tax=Streptomyces sp. NBC_00090 TaxID=2903619 RepID=UPI00324E78AE